MKQTAILFLSFIIFNPIINAQQLEWAITMEGSESPSFGNGTMNDIKVNANGDVLLTGHFSGTVDFDPGLGIYNLTSIGYIDAIVQKLDSNGNLIWAKNMGGSHTVDGMVIEIDNFGNVYSAGEFRTTSDFDPGPGVHNLVPTGENDMYIQKLDSNGNFVWAKSIGGTGIEHISPHDIILDDNNNIYILGYAPMGADLDPGLGTFFASTDGMFILKLDPNGNLTWAKNIPVFGESMTMDKSGNIFCCGSFKGTVDFDAGPGTTSLSSSPSSFYSSAFILKLDSNGNFIWVKANYGSDHCIAKSIVIDSDHNIYVGGSFRETADFDTDIGVFNLTSIGSSNSYIQKLDPNGNLIWAKRMGGTFVDWVHRMAIDSADEIYLAGKYLYHTIDLDPNEGTFNLTNAGESDIFLQKLNADGDLIWAKSIGGPGVESLGNLVVDASKKVYTTGSFHLTIDLNPNIGVSNFTCNTGADIFVQKLNACVPDVDVVAACSSYTWIDGITYTTNNNTATHTLTNSIGCDSVITLNLTITNPDTTTTVVGTTITANGSGTDFYYYWLDCNNNFELLEYGQQSYTATTNGAYALSIIQNGCIDTSACINIQSVGIDKINPLFEDVIVYPNPNYGEVSINLKGLEDVSIEIFAVNGLSVYHQENIYNQIHQFKLNEPDGIYFIEVDVHHIKKYYKLVKITKQK